MPVATSRFEGILRKLSRHAKLCGHVLDNVCSTRRTRRTARRAFEAHEARLFGDLRRAAPTDEGPGARHDDVGVELACPLAELPLTTPRVQGRAGDRDAVERGVRATARLGRCVQRAGTATWGRAHIAGGVTTLSERGEGGGDGGHENARHESQFWLSPCSAASAERAAMLARVRRLPALPLVHGLENLSFRCSGCGNCCRDLRVAVTHLDVARLVAATGEAPAALTSWLGADDVDRNGEAASFVELNVGPRLLVLAQRDGACRWLDEAQRCRVYAARPLDCRAYPFSIDSDAGGVSARLSLLALTSCDEVAGSAPNPLSPSSESCERLRAQDDARWRELEAYQALVARWNRLARHRRRLGHRARGAVDFFEFLGLCSQALAQATRP